MLPTRKRDDNTDDSENDQSRDDDSSDVHSSSTNPKAPSFSHFPTTRTYSGSSQELRDTEYFDNSGDDLTIIQQALVCILQV